MAENTPAKTPLGDLSPGARFRWLADLQDGPVSVIGDFLVVGPDENGRLFRWVKATNTLTGKVESIPAHLTVEVVDAPTPPLVVDGRSPAAAAHLPAPDAAPPDEDDEWPWERGPTDRERAEWAEQRFDVLLRCRDEAADLLEEARSRLLAFLRGLPAHQEMKADDLGIVGKINAALRALGRPDEV